MAERGPAIWVWDPNPFNPYGTEVARVIAASGHRVRISSRRHSAIRADGVHHWPVLPQPAAGTHSLAHKAAYAWAVARFFVGALLHRATVVVAWANTTPERVAILLVSKLGARTVMILHNPIPARETVPAGSLRQRMRSAASLRVVHTPELTRFVDGEVAVAAHPAYFAWLRSVRVNEAPLLESANSPVGGPLGLFLGAMRADKGIDLLPELDRLMHERGATLALCVGRADAFGRDVLTRCTFAWHMTSGDAYIPDSTVLAALDRSDVLVAPYRDVTASGTALMALTAGTPVATFATDAMRALLPAESLAAGEGAESLAEAVSRASEISPDSCRARASDADRASEADWDALLRRLNSRPRTTKRK